MSAAFTLSNKHISAMLNATFTLRNLNQYYFDGKWKTINFSESGQVLLDQNIRSVNTRYGKNESSKFSYIGGSPRLAPAQLIRACDCYAYQSMETEDWEKTEAHAIYNTIREAAISALVDAHHEADNIWDID